MFKEVKSIHGKVVKVGTEQLIKQFSRPTIIKTFNSLLLLMLIIY